MQEIWKDIPNYDGLYQVSNLGNVRSMDRKVHRNDKYSGCLHTVNGKILKPMEGGHGYLYVNLYKNGKRKLTPIHRIVSIVFIKNEHGYKQVNHIDENKRNNCVCNLEWCDCKYNNNYGTHKEKASNTRSVAVYQYTLSGEFVSKYKNAKEAARSNNIHFSGIYCCCERKIKFSHGFIWRYEGDSVN